MSEMVTSKYPFKGIKRAFNLAQPIEVLLSRKLPLETTTPAAVIDCELNRSLDSRKVPNFRSTATTICMPLSYKFGGISVNLPGALYFNTTNKKNNTSLSGAVILEGLATISTCD